MSDILHVDYELESIKVVSINFQGGRWHIQTPSGALLGSWHTLEEAEAGVTDLRAAIEEKLRHVVQIERGRKARSAALVKMILETIRGRVPLDGRMLADVERAIADLAD